MSGAVLRPLVLLPAAAALVAVLAAVLGRGSTAPAAQPPVAMSPVVLLAMLVAVAALVGAALVGGSGLRVWRWTLTALAVFAAAYPATWAVATLVSLARPGSALAWSTAVAAVVGHLPVLAAFSVLPLLAVRYVSRVRTTAALLSIGVVGALAVLSFVLFFDPVEPFAADALVAWGPGQVIGPAVNLVFLATVLVGPVAALHAVRRADVLAARRLALIAASSLAGTALVMLCGAVAGRTGGVAVLVGMYAAVAVVGTGCSRALALQPAAAIGAPGAVGRATTTPVLPVLPVLPGGPPGPPVHPVAGLGGLAGLTGREEEVLELLAQGMSNAGIAARLVVSERTVDAHLRSVFQKLDLPQGPATNRRVHAAARWVAARGPVVTTSRQPDEQASTG